MIANSLVNQIGGQLLGGALVVVAGFLPFGGLMWWVHRRRSRFRAEYLEPFTDMPLRPPGESLREKIDVLNDELEIAVMTLAGTSAVCTAWLMLSPLKSLALTWSVGALLLVVAYVMHAPKLLRHLRLLWDYRLGLKGECAVGQELNQLVADGFQVFHDVPFDNFNIDHVIVGPAGVWAVETKTRRKPAALKGTAKATVTYDGRVLHFPGFVDIIGLEQAERNAVTLSKWLTKSTGEATSVSAMLVLPGWWVERTARGPVNVLNPKEVRRAFPKNLIAGPRSDRLQRIAFQLTTRCQLKRST